MFSGIVHLQHVYITFTCYSSCQNLRKMEDTNPKPLEATIENLPEMLAQLKKPSEKFKMPDFSQFHTEARERLESVNKTLREVEKSLNDTRMQAHMLNVDLVTMFDPQEMDELHTIKKECEKLLEQSKIRLAQQKWLLRMAETNQPIPVEIDELKVLPEDIAEIEAETEAIIKSFHLKGSSDKLAHELAACAVGKKAAADLNLQLDVPIKVADQLDFSLITEADVEHYMQMKSCVSDEAVQMESDEIISENAEKMDEAATGGGEEEVITTDTDIQQVPLMEL